MLSGKDMLSLITIRMMTRTLCASESLIMNVVVLQSLYAIGHLENKMYSQDPN